MAKVKLPQQLECLRCGKKWLPRKPEVRMCPKCKSPYWDTPKRTKTGKAVEDATLGTIGVSLLGG